VTGGNGVGTGDSGQPPSMPNTETVDAVVIGAGHNGLVAANLLADAGWHVLVLEAQDQPGGAVRTVDITAPGFHSDHCAAFFPLSAVSPALTGLELERYGLRWRHAPEVLAHVLPDDRAALLSRDLDTTAASVASFAAEDGPAWRRMAEQWAKIRPELISMLLRPFPPVRPALSLLRRLNGGELLPLVRMASQPARVLTTEWFAGEGARMLLAGNAMHADLGVDNAGSGLFGWVLAMLAQEVGFPVPEGGAGALTDALMNRLAARGGTVRCGRRVERVLVAGGRALGVRDDSGATIRARRAVLADVAAPLLYGELIEPDELPANVLTRLREFRWDSSTIKVDWALSEPVPWTAPEARRAGTVHLGADLQGMTAFGADLARDRTPRTPFLVLGQMTTADPSRSPAGTEVVWAYTHVPQGKQWDAGRLARQADRITSIIERHAPGFTDRIIARHVDGPEQLQAQNENLVGGAINGGTSALYQQLVFRPLPGLGRADTPVDGLFLASSSAHPGGGVHGAPGANAARAALIRAGMAGSAYRTVVGGLFRSLGYR
jgi:phytoene dehydrogenase-like protein